MKQTLLSIFLLTRLALQAQLHAPADSIAVALKEINPDSSAIGAPIGAKASRTIGPEGGSIVSADGMMELIFPEGALTAPTEIGIQPVENTSAAGFGHAYACTPDGTHFQKPVQMTIHYTDSAAKGISPAIQTIHWQDNTGHWSQVEKVKVDSAARLISCGIEHFSTQTAATSFKIIPRFAMVKVKQERMFMLTITGTYPDGKKYESGVDADLNFWKTETVEWSVDGIVGGNDISGRIRPFAPDQMNGAIYTAPAVVPPTPVDIRAKYLGIVKMGPGSFAENVVSMVAVDVYDEFHYSFIGYDKVGHLHMTDSATCNIEVYSSGIVKLSNIKNPTPWSDWPPKLGECSYTYLDKTGWKGMVQIAGMKSGQFLREPGAANGQVLIQLRPTMGSSPSYTQKCKRRTSNVPSMPVEASPGSIQFEPGANGDIRIHYGPAQGDNILNEFRSGDQGFSIRISRIP